MNEHTTHPRSARRHPRALFGRLQVYAQNNPRAYAVRASLVILPLALLPPLVLCVILLDDWSLMLPMLLSAAVPALVVCALMALFMPRIIRRMLGTSTLSPDTDPADLLEAKRQLRRGGLHEREEVNRAARVVAAQAESKVNSPKTVNIMGLIGAAFFAVLAALTYTAMGANPSFWFQVAVVLVFLSYPLFLGPWVKRYRQRARDFAELYDTRQVELEQDAHPKGG